MNKTLVIMLKEPVPGRVKTRLGREIGMTAAAWWFRHQTRRLLRAVTDPRWQVVLAVSPDQAGLRSRIWPSGCVRFPQGRGDLGDRMSRAFRSQTPGPVCIIGADIPGISRGHIARAFKALGAADAVIGPAPDGGYWLIGLKAPASAPRSMFDGVRWSTEHALADTLATMPDHKIRFVDALRDIDTVVDLRMTSEGTRDTSWQ